MPFHRRFQGSPVKRDKHEIVWSFLSTSAATATNVLLTLGVNVGSKGSPTEAAVGSHVRGIYLEFNFSAEDVTAANIIHWFVIATKSGQTISNPNLYYEDIRSDILKRGMEMLPKDVSTVFKRIVFVPIPKKFQRISEGMQIQFRFIGSGAGLINACGFAVYKEIY